MDGFIYIFFNYLYEILPALAIGFFISGIVHEMIPEDKVLKYLGTGGIAPVFYSTLIGTLLPVCCWGSLPIAVSFYKKGARLGPVLAFLVATPYPWKDVPRSHLLLICFRSPITASVPAGA